MYIVDLEYLNICKVLCMYMNLGIYEHLFIYIHIYICI